MMVYMQEIVELLLNIVYCVFLVYFVFKLVFDWFDYSFDVFNCVFMKKLEKDGFMIKWIEIELFNVVLLFYMVVGMYVVFLIFQVNMDYWEVYQKVFEFCCKQCLEVFWEVVKDENYDLVLVFFDNEQMGIVVLLFD